MSYEIQKQLLALERDKKVIELLNNLKSFNVDEEQHLKNQKELYHYILKELNLSILKNVQCGKFEDLQIFTFENKSEMRIINPHFFTENINDFFRIDPLLSPSSKRGVYEIKGLRDYQNSSRTFKFYKEFTYKNRNFKICVASIHEVYKYNYDASTTLDLKPLFLEAESNLLAMKSAKTFGDYIFHLFVLNEEQLKPFVLDYFENLLKVVIYGNALDEKAYKKTKSGLILKDLSNITDAEAEDIVKQLTL